MANWCELPWPALDLIAKTLTFYLDYIRFRSVCRSWRSAAPRRPYLPVLAAHRADDDGNRTIFSFFEFNGSELLPIAGGHHLPETHIGSVCCGASHGWMGFLSRNLDVDLWNPLTKSHIQLPSLAGHPDFDFSIGDLEHAFADGREVMTDTDDPTQIRNYLSVKLLLSSDPSVDPSCVALLLHCHGRKFVVCRIGERAWTPVRSRHELAGWDTGVVFYKGRFHMVSGEVLYALNLGAGPELERIRMSNPPYDESSCLPEIHLRYLVESSGDLLLVNACHREFSSPAAGGKEYSFEVYKVDWGMHRVKLLKLRTVGDRALFFGRNHSFSLPVGDLPGCKSNCLYMGRSFDGDGAYMWIYDMEDGTNSMIPIPSADPSSQWLPCTWITPSLLQ